MNNMRQIIFVLCTALAACEQQPAETVLNGASQNAASIVMASNYPLYFFAHELVGDSGAPIDIRFPERMGDPANWEPDSAAITGLQNARLILLNGAGYELWLGWVTLPGDRLLDTSVEFTDRLIPLLEESVHQHGPAGEHSHTGTAFTVWLDPSLAIQQAQAIEHALSALAPDHAQSFKTNLAILLERLKSLDRDQQQAFQALAGQALIFSHPVYQYLQARYGLNGLSLHWEPEEYPGPRAWIDLHEILSRHPATLMLWEDEPLAETRKQLQQSGIRSVPFHTASNRPASGDYFDVMNANLERLKGVATEP